ncbi:MBL fold metallo-hydrolase [Methylotenera mobilis]|uniref:Beta-lactamase domain protein n=1 Tax=Methylotenera mobilis (strain JLW8 / ATCC BAA-1282 / DSM 17540) TaxID=583345 RepID=C6WZ13_METML|nr:MBL fold metallo-hydrolase [Methylotenera mobilis]ACT48961.1 beta-lactamase domain protein [Methylotenera mobilis JLW8]
MRFRFVGACGGSVTGSCTHFSYNRTNIQFLVDCGLIQGEGDESIVNSKPFPFRPSEIEFILLTHAHLDHCGLIPRLYKEGFTGKVICTTATARMAKISLTDSAKHLKDIYSENDVKKIRFECIDQRKEFGLSRLLPIHTDLFASFSRTAHILGSATITVSWINDADEKASVVMSGDLGNNTKENPYQPLLASRQGVFGYPDAIVVESTYGAGVRDSECSDYDARLSALHKVIQDEVFNKKSLLIIPAFSIQRTQELLVDIYCVFNQFYSTNDSIQSPIHIINQFYDEFESGCWGFIVQKSLKNAIDKLPINEQEKWLKSIKQIDEVNKAESKSNFSLSENAEISIADIKKLITSTTNSYPIDIKLDSGLAREMSTVYHEELCRPQIKKPEETLYRNRKMASRLGVEDGVQVDEFIKSIFPNNSTTDIEIPLGEHKIQYVTTPKTPRVAELQERGGILITGGGMCNGGPVVSHIEKVIDAKRNSTILLTGYMAKNSVGEKLMKHSQATPKEIEASTESWVLGSKEVLQKNITTNIIQLQGFYSGHADQSGLLDFIFEIVGEQKQETQTKPSAVFINHGQPKARAELKDAIEARLNSGNEGDRNPNEIYLPDSRQQWYDFNSKKWIAPVPNTRTEDLLQDLLSEQLKTNVLLQRLVDQLASNKYANNNIKKK